MQGSATQYLSVLLEPYSLLRSLRSASKLLYNCPHLVLEYTDIDPFRFVHQDFGIHCQCWGHVFLRKLLIESFIYFGDCGLCDDDF